MTRLKLRGWNTLGIVLALLVWQIVGMRVGDALLATPMHTGLAIAALVVSAKFWSAFAAMVLQMFIGYALALLVGIPLGIAMGRNRWVRMAVTPWANMFVVISAAALVPLFIILLGRGELLSTTIVFCGTVWYVVLSMTQAARQVSPRLLAVARSFGATPLQSFRLVLLPAVHPYILIAARIGLTHALRAMVTVQMFVSLGFGGLLNDAGLDISTADLLGLIVVLMVASTLATSVLRWISHRAAPWYRSRTGES